MRRPRICIFTETYHPEVGGGETQARALAEGLAARGYGVLVLTRRSEASFPEVESYGDVAVHRLPPVGPGHLKKWGLLPTGFLALARLRRKYDLVFVSGFRAVGPAAVLASRLFGKGCVLKADSLGETSGSFFEAGLSRLPFSPPPRLLKAALGLRNWVLRRADAFVAICSDVETELLADGVRPNAIWRIPNSVDTARFSPVTREEQGKLRQRLGVIPKELLVTFTGRLVSYKGLPLLVRVWKEIQRRHPEAGLLLVGSGGLDVDNCEAELRAYVKENGLGDGIQFVGSVSNVHEYLQASDLFVLPTENEGLSLALIEAMACGLPVVSTSVGGVKDILTHGEDGLVVQPGDPQQLREALDDLLSNPLLASRLGQAARQTALNRYRTEVVIEQLVALFGQTLKRSGYLWSRTTNSPI